MEELLEKARKVADEAEVFFLRHWDEPVSFEANRLKLVARKESSGAALRILKGGRVGISSTTNLNNLDGLVDNALEVASLGPPVGFQFPPYSSLSPVEVYDPQVESTTAEEMIHLGQSLVDRVRDGWADLMCDARVSRGVTSLTILNTRGGYSSYIKSVFSVSVHGTLVKDTDMLFVSDWAASCHPIQDITGLAETVRLQLEHSRNIVPAPTADGGTTVVFTPRGFAGALLPPLLAGFNGKTVLQKASPLVGMLGEPLFDERLSLWDDPTTPFTPGSRMCDDEGVPTRVVPLIDGGVVGSFLYDLQTAFLAGVESTGSAHRGLSTLPEPGMSVTTVGEGEVSYTDMIKGVRSGLVVESLLGAGQSNILGGDFNANVLLGFCIERGEIIGRVKNTVISGNVYKVLRNIGAIEDTNHWVGGAVRTPALATLGISVATKG